MSMQRCGGDEVLKSIEDGEEVSLILVKRDTQSIKISKILNYAEELAIRVIYGSENDLWRMSRNNSNGTPDILCLVGRNPESSMDEVLSKGGLIWLLAGASYPVNIGFCIRTAEVSGADAVVIDAELNNQERSAAKRASMKAHRFLPLFWNSGVEFILKARELSGKSNLLYMRDSLSGKVVAKINKSKSSLNKILHKND